MPPFLRVWDSWTQKPFQSTLNREQRLDSNVKTLYHQTSPQNAESIQKSNTMLPGSGGLAGGGIYFATTAEDTDHKALSRGVVLTADVRLGRVKTLDMNGDPTMTFERLEKEGYDSTMIMRPGGIEYVVYNPDQVSNIAVFAVRSQQHHEHSFNRNGRFSRQPTGHMNF